MAEHSAVTPARPPVSARRGQVGGKIPPAAARAQVVSIVKRSRSSFQTGMRLLPPRRRLAMYGVYAFCRSVDDIADGDAARSDKIRGLEEWRAEIDAVYAGTPSGAVGQVLAWAASRYDLPRAEFDAVIAGMRHDVDGGIDEESGVITLADRHALALYARQVAGAVGILSVRIFGVRHADADRFAVVLGEALQIANILRDIDEDAAIGRLYVPQSYLSAHDVPAGTPESVVRHPHFPAACTDLAREAEEKFDEARRIVASIRSPRLAPAMVMMAVYADLLVRLGDRGWAYPRRPVVRSGLRKAAVAIRGAALGWRWPSFT